MSNLFLTKKNLHTHSTTTSKDQVSIDALCTFYFLWLPFPIRILSRFEFGQDARIIKHEDIWSMRDLIASIWILGWFYELFRNSLGGLSSWWMEKFLEK